MKKLILAGCVSLLGVFASAQLSPPAPVPISKDAVSYLPQQASGFLILNKFKHESVTQWIVEVQTRSYDSIIRDYNYVTVKNIILSDSYFTKLDDYGDGSYFVSVTGKDAGGGVVAQQGPLAYNTEGEIWYNDCGWQCIGKTYAYGLELMVNYDNTSSRIEMTNARPPIGSLYHYEWMSPDDFTTLSGNTTGYTFYGLSSWLNSIENQGKIITLHGVTQPNAKKNKDGIDVWGTVIGVSKNYGPWKETFSMSESNQISSGNDNCIQSFDWAKNMVNSGDYITANPSFALSCNGTSSGDSDPYTPSSGSLSESYFPCWEIVTGTLDQNVGGFVETLTSSSGCFFNGVGNGNGGYSWPEDIALVTLSPFDNDGSEDPIVLTEASLFDTRGNYIGAPISFKKGLYYVGIQYTDASYGSVFFESKSNAISTLTQAQFLAVTAFPVPIENNQFSLDLTASADLSFKYVLLNASSEVILEKNYILEKDSKILDHFTLPAQTEPGILFNKVIFNDGSEINFQTIK